MKLFLYCAKREEFNGLYFTIVSNKKELREAGNYTIVDIIGMNKETFLSSVNETPANNIRILFNDKYTCIAEYNNSSETYRIIINYNGSTIESYNLQQIK